MELYAKEKQAPVCQVTIFRPAALLEAKDSLRAGEESRININRKKTKFEECLILFDSMEPDKDQNLQTKEKAKEFSVAVMKILKPDDPEMTEVQFDEIY